MVNRIIKFPKNGSFFVFGARGTGKTTWLKKVYPDSLYINLLLAKEEESLSRNPESLRDRIKATNKSQKIIIDEIQKIPKLLDEIHQLIEDGEDRFVLTGSSARKLKRGSANLLGGRAAFRSLHPLSIFEWEGHFTLNQVLSFGALPKLLNLSDTESKIDYLQSYVRTYIKEEIQLEQTVRHLDPFRSFLEIAAQMNGKILNFSKIHRDVGASVKTIQSYYQILEDTHLGFFVPGFHESWRKQLSQAPRFYFFDTGVTRALARQIQIELSESTFEFGNLFEQFVICECFRMNEYLNKEYKFSYLRTKDGAEIDLIIDRPGLKRVLLEIKSSKSIQAEDIPHIIHFHKEFSKTEAYCVSLDPHPKVISGVHCLPLANVLKSIGLS